jgi:ferredoxin
MKTAIIYVFSGTFHTLKAARLICGALEKRGVAAKVCEVKKPFDAIPSPEGYDLVGFGYPVHAYNAPQMFVEFVRRLPPLKRRAFLFKTSGEPFRMNNASSCLVFRLLENKGYDVRLETHMLMPYNIMFRYPDSLAKQMYLYTQAQSDLLALRFLKGDRDHIRFNPGHRLLAFLMRIEWPGAKLNGLLYRVDRKKCTQCRSCVSMCPASNIRMENGRIRFGGQCAMCMRCAMFCPHDAIRVGLLRFWKLNGGYSFQRLLADPDVPTDYVRKETKGYFRLFRKYYRKADAMLARYGIQVEPPQAQQPDSDFADAPDDVVNDAVGMG